MRQALFDSSLQVQAETGQARVVFMNNLRVFICEALTALLLHFLGGVRAVHAAVAVADKWRRGERRSTAVMVEQISRCVMIVVIKKQSDFRPPKSLFG